MRRGHAEGFRKAQDDYIELLQGGREAQFEAGYGKGVKEGKARGRTAK